MRRLLIPAIATVALLAAGCASIVSDSGTQPGGIGPVRLTAHVCVGDQGTGTDCSTYQTLGSSAQEMIAVRAPSGLTLPASLTVDGYVLKANKSYADALTALHPPSAGQAWYGYATEGAVTGTQGDAHDIVIDVPLPGAPFTGPLKARIVTGYRTLTPVVETGAEPFDCSATTTTHCVFSPADPTVDHEYATRDLAVGAADAVTATAGSTASITFPVRFRGTSGPSFDQTAATTIDGATATPRNVSITPATDEDRTETVDVAIPEAATPGDYTVTLTDKTGSQTRSGTATLTVTPAPEPTVTATPTPTPKPTVTAAPTAQPTPFAKVKPASFSASAKPKRDRRKPYRFTVKGKLGRPSNIGQDGVTCAGKVKVVARRYGISVGSRTTTVTSACTYAVTVTVSKKGRITLETRFAGNAVFLARSAKALRVRTG